MTTETKLTASQIDVIMEKCKTLCSYERQLAVCGKKDADNVLYFTMKGYEENYQQTASLQKEIEELTSKYQELWNNKTRQQMQYNELKQVASEMAKALEESNNTINWMMSSMSVIDPNDQADSFNLSANSLTENDKAIDSYNKLTQTKE